MAGFLVWPTEGMKMCLDMTMKNSTATPFPGLESINNQIPLDLLLSFEKRPCVNTTKHSFFVNDA
jgi:hypothetical protein